jgi:histidinol-phosphate phosphatase family protein
MKAVFVDKDGTLVEDVPYNVDPSLLRFTPRAVPALQLLAREGFAIVIVSNQPGLALGRFTRSEFATLQRALVARIRDEAGVEVAGFYACPHAPGPGHVPACLCRKPAPGLLRQAAIAHRIDLGASWMVGDILDDVEAGRRAGCRSILLDVGNETVWRMSPLRTPHHRCRDLYEAARVIAGRSDLDVRAETPDSNVAVMS